MRGHPLGVVMLLKTGSDQVRLKPKPIEGVVMPTGVEPQKLLLDGQQRLTSLTQALGGEGLVSTMDSRGKKLTRKYYIDIAVAFFPSYGAMQTALTTSVARASSTRPRSPPGLTALSAARRPRSTWSRSRRRRRSRLLNSMACSTVT
jgi:hypothetical protein